MLCMKKHMTNLTCIEYGEDSDSKRKTRVYLGPVLTHLEVCQIIAQVPLQRRVAEGQIFIGDEHFLVTDIFIREHEVIFKENTYRRNLPSKLVDLSSPG